MAGYFGEAGTKVTWKNPQFVPESQRQNGGWYYNPNTGRVDRWWNQGSGPQASSGGGQQQRQTSYEDIIRAQEDAARRAAEERRKKGQEQLELWNSFMKDPNFFDEVLARKMSMEKMNRYYETLLKEFVEPLRMKIQQSQEMSDKVIQELATRREIGEEERKTEIQDSLEAAKEGFAGSGLYGSGLAKSSLARKRIRGEQNLADFINLSKQEEEQQKLQTKQTVDTLGLQEKQKEAEYFGEGRLRDEGVSMDLAAQKQEATKRQAIKAYETITSRYGGDVLLSNLPDFLRY